MHNEAMAFVQKILSSSPARRSVIEIGAKNVNGSVRALFGSALYLGVDIAPGPGVDIVADGAHLSAVGLDVPDTVVCCEVLEHAPNARELVLNAGRLLGPGGFAIFTAACDPRAPHSAIDGGPLRAGEFYRNVPPEDLHDWLNTWAKKCHVEAHRDRGDTYAIARK